MISVEINTITKQTSTIYECRFYLNTTNQKILINHNSGLWLPLIESLINYFNDPTIDYNAYERWSCNYTGIVKFKNREDVTFVLLKYNGISQELIRGNKL
jgi:hypothetical protein